MVVKLVGKQPKDSRETTKGDQRMLRNKKSNARKLLAFLMIITLTIPSTFAFGQTKDYYYEGQAAATRDYTGGGAVVGGAASGFILGLIGWGLGYLIVSSQGADVPHHYTSNFDTTQRMQFEQGYKDYVKKTRKGKFNMGAGVGTLAAVVLVLSVAGE